MVKECIVELKTLNKSHNLFLPFLLLIISIPLPVFINNILLLLITVKVFIRINKAQINYNSSLVFLILFFLLCSLSLSWSIDYKSSLNTLPRLIPMILLPSLVMVYQPFEPHHKKAILKYYSFAMVCLALAFILRAAIRYFITNDSRVFFYHGENDLDYGLVPKLLNAIHVSVFVAIGYFFFVSKEVKKTMDYIAILVLAGFILLLSSKNIIFLVIFLTIIHFFYFSRISHNLRLKNLIVFILLIALAFSYAKIRNRFKIELQTNTYTSLSTNVIERIPANVHYVSMQEAWSSPMFTVNDYFNGSAFRVYQFRIFNELIKEKNVFFTVFGLNESYPKIEEKAIYYNLYMGEKNVQNRGYQSMNFHNQYIQNFADLGVFGFLLMLCILFINVKNSISSKDFVHFAFAILMISLFLTESFLWRQRGVVFFTMLYCLFNSVTNLRDYSNNSKAE